MAGRPFTEAFQPFLEVYNGSGEFVVTQNSWQLPQRRQCYHVPTQTVGCCNRVCQNTSAESEESTKSSTNS